MTVHDDWMRLAIGEAGKAHDIGEVPIGCIVVHEPSGKVIGARFNRRIADRDPTGHAEVLAIRAAAAVIGDWRLVDCVLVVTLEPCPMCAGAIVNARIPKLVFGCRDPKAGAVRTLYQVCEDDRLNHRVEVSEGVLADECAGLLRDFFKVQRGLGKK